MTSDRLAKFPFLPGPVPLNIVGGEGSYLFAEGGRRILDGGGGAIVTNVGHGRPEPAEAAAAVIRGGGYVVPVWATESRLRLIERTPRPVAAAGPHPLPVRVGRLGVGRLGHEDRTAVPRGSR